MIHLYDVLRSLSCQRPIFHSEADFQHALAWLIHLQHPDAIVRLEYRPLPQKPFNPLTNAFRQLFSSMTNLIGIISPLIF